MKFRIKQSAERILEFMKGKKRNSTDPIRRVDRYRQRCNLCNRIFRSNSRYLRFCKSCRNEDEVFRFADWLGV